MAYNSIYANSNPGFQGASMRDICSQAKRMTLSGKGVVKAKPDVAFVNLGVESQGKNLQEVQQENAIIANRIVNTLIKLGINENNIQTFSYIINPEYDYIEGKQVFKGYRVIHNYKIALDNTESVGRIIDAAVGSGANIVGNIEFGITKGSIYYNQALNLAIEDAINKAENIERRFNYIINKVPYSIKEESYGQPIVMESTAFKAQSSTPVKSGLLDITAAVTVVFCYN